MAKTSGKEILSRVKKRQAEEVKTNITFRVKGELLERFRERCEKEGVSMTSVLEELIGDFLS
jgi:hypothetical protein